MTMTGAIASETELIQTYLAPLAAGWPGAAGLRDDAAVVPVPADHDLVVTTDPIRAGVHFFADDDPAAIAWKALAINVSDLAAKGASPHGYTMALAFPSAPTHDWMAAFAAGLAHAQSAFGCHLVGGDTDRADGPLSIAITAFGTVPAGAMVPRHGAGPGDAILLTGTLGDSAAGLALRRDAAAFGRELTSGDRDWLIDRYLRPQPRLAMLPLLRRHASAALDLSDGFLKDAARLCTAGRLVVRAAALPMSPTLSRALSRTPAKFGATVLSGGDDYEVLFAIPAERVAGFRVALATLPFQVTMLGKLDEGSGIAVTGDDGEPLDVASSGYDHFA